VRPGAYPRVENLKGASLMNTLINDEDRLTDNKKERQKYIKKEE
jgi:hypothetical protein